MPQKLKFSSFDVVFFLFLFFCLSEEKKVKEKVDTYRPKFFFFLAKLWET